MACPYFLGKQPVAKDLLNRRAIKGDSKLRSSLTNHVGAGSNWQVLLDDELISFSTSSAVTGLHSLMAWPAVSGMSCGGVVEVVERMESALSEKNLAKSSAVQSPSSHRPPGFSPIIPAIVCHNFFMLPLLSAIFIRQYWWSFSSYRATSTGV